MSTRPRPTPETIAASTARAATTRLANRRARVAAAVADVLAASAEESPPAAPPLAVRRATRDRPRRDLPPARPDREDTRRMTTPTDARTRLAETIAALRTALPELDGRTDEELETAVVDATGAAYAPTPPPSTTDTLPADPPGTDAEGVELCPTCRTWRPAGTIDSAGRCGCADDDTPDDEGAP